MHVRLNRVIRGVTAVLLILSVSGCCELPKPRVVVEPPPSPPPPPKVSKLEQKLAAFDARLAAKREELKIPGLSLVIVKDNKIVYLKGHGLRNIEQNLPTTEDTLFAIGSTTKAFTATLALMAVDEGKLSLDDSPQKYLPYFSLKDKEADAKITVRNLFTHTSGLGRTDLGWITGKLTKEEVIKTAGLAEPVCKLGEEFNYQNVMYLAAGECVASALGKSYADLLQERIFDPLGMRSSNVSVAKTLTLETRAVGYAEDYQTKKIIPATMRPADNIAPAGAINASARDMGQWLRFNMGRGQIDGQRLVKEETFAQLFKPYYSFTESDGYGLGWGIGTWNGLKEASHSGGIDGFITLVSFLPEEKVGFALFTNIEKFEIQGWVTNEVYSMLTDSGETEATVAAELPPGAEKEVGTYGVLGGEKLSVQIDEGKLMLLYPNRPPTTLEPVKDRRYRFGPPAPPGLFITFREGEKYEDEDEVLIEQPWGNIIWRRLTPEMIEEAKNKEPPPELVEYIGTYAVKDRPIEFKIYALEGRVVMQPPGDVTFPLVSKGKDEFTFDGRVKGLALEMHRDAKGKVTGATYTAFNDKTELTRIADVEVPTLNAEELLAKVAKAHRSKRLGKLKSLVIHYTVDFVNQGLKGKMTLYRQAPDRYAEDISLVAFDREIGKWRDAYDGTNGFEAGDFWPVREITETQLDGYRYRAVFNPFEKWDTLYETVGEVTTSKIGDEVVYVVEKRRKSGIVVTDYYSAKTFLLLKKQTRTPIRPDWPPQVLTEVFKDYRNVRGLMLPYLIETDDSSGKTSSVIEKVELNTDIPKDVFQMPPWAGY